MRIVKTSTTYSNFVPEFEKFYEVRTYWLNGKYFIFGTMIDPTYLGVSGFEKVKFVYPES